MFNVSAKSRFAALAGAVVLIAALGSAGSAQAAPFHHRHHGWGGPLAAGLALGLVGAAVASSASAAYVEDDEGVVCRREPRYNAYGDYIGRVRVCRSVY